MSKMLSLIVTQSITVVRDGKRVTPPLNKPFDFTQAEATLVLKANPQGLRKPVNETAAFTDDADEGEDEIDDADDADEGEDEPDAEEDAAPAVKKPAAKKPAAKKPAAKKPASEDDDI